MRIDPVGGGNYSHDPNSQLSGHQKEIRNEYQKLLEKFRKHPTEGVADKLIAFLKEHYKALKKIADENPNHGPHTIPTFDNSYQSSLTALQGWETKLHADPQKATIPEEFLGDLNDWITF